MNITIIGTGSMARGIGKRLVAGGHGVTVLGREPGNAAAVVEDIGGDPARAGRSGDSIADEIVVYEIPE